MPSRRPKEHTFVVLAFGDSPHLDDCLRSLRGQAEASDVLLSTSTPSAHVIETARRYGVAVKAVPGARGIGADWNAALATSQTDWVTLAHQDDVYLPNFGKSVRQSLAEHPEALLCFTGYREMSGGCVLRKSPNLLVKDLLLAMSFRRARSIESPAGKRLLLALGSPIPCPAVTFNLPNLDGFAFSTELRVNLDWAAWLDLADRPGSFVRVREALMHHRLHEESTTWNSIRDGARRSEDRACFCRVWPRGLAGALCAAYGLSYRFNRIGSRRATREGG